MPEFAAEERNKVRRAPNRAKYDRDTVYAIIDEALYCHIGFVQEGRPYVIPANHGRSGDRLLLHGSVASRMLNVVESGAPLCVAFTLLDGLVLARSVFSHSVNYRSAVIFGSGELILDPDEKWSALETITEHIMPGRWADARQPTAKELAATAVVAVGIESASAKVRTGPPGDSEQDYALPVWAGVLPVRRTFLDPQPDPARSSDIDVPDYMADYWRSQLSVPVDARQDENLAS
jgi:nitroimidazol reductase NimA-like FMN-containing flavoprotein (pyridoxamine 5'-phosphate oxidase superfamily)